VVKIGFVQPKLKPNAALDNLERCIALASTLDRPDLVVFPELVNSAYGFKNRRELRDISEEIPTGPSTRRLQVASTEMECAIVTGLAERNGPLVHSSALVVDAGEFVGTYRKVHLYGRETQFFEPGRDLAEVYYLRKFRLAVQICLDLGFPEELGRLSRLGVQVVAHPANLSIAHSGPPQTIKAKENRAYVVTSNRVGEERAYSRPTTFTGESMILSPDLDILALASNDREEALEVDVMLGEEKVPPSPTVGGLP
jgi:beta-ureidopropionase